MLALVGFSAIIILLIVILKKWLSPLAALILVPVVALMLAGQIENLNVFALDGIQSVSATAAMFVFAIIFFGVMSDAGLFNPFISLTLKIVGNSPTKIAIGTVALSSLVHLDGSGASTFLIAAPALLPLYDYVGMDRKVLAACIAMAAGVNNMLPWGGPTIRAATAMEVNVVDMYMPIMPIHLFGLCLVFVLAGVLGFLESRRLSVAAAMSDEPRVEGELSGIDLKFFINLALTGVILYLLVSGALHPALAFMIGTVLAFLINYPKLTDQAKKIDQFAPAALMMAAVLFAAGIFTGILKGSGMLDAMATVSATVIPEFLATELPVIMGVVSMPLSLLFDPDSFYFGILPVIANIAEQVGVDPISVAHGALMGQMTTGFPISPLTPATFLLIGLTRIDLADHQKFTFPLLLILSVSMSLFGWTIGVL